MAENHKEDKDEDNVTAQESSIARSHPAVYVDAFLLEDDPVEGFFRMTFGEGTASRRERIRFALMMPVEDVRQLARMLTELLSKHDKKKVAQEHDASHIR